MTTLKRKPDASIDRLVLEGLKLIRFTATQVIQQAEKIRKANPSATGNSELNFLNLLAGMDPKTASFPRPEVKSEADAQPSTSGPKLVIPEKSIVSQMKFNNYQEIIKKPVENSHLNEIESFLEDYYEPVNSRVKHHALKTKKLRAYAAKVRKNQCQEVIEFIVDRPSVFRNLIVMIDKHRDRDQILFTFKEQKSVFVKKLEKLCKVKDMELFAQRETVVIPKKLDNGAMKGVFVYYLVRSLVLRPTNLDEMLIRFKEHVLRAKISGVTLPTFSEETENLILEAVEKGTDDQPKKERKKREKKKDKENKDAEDVDESEGGSKESEKSLSEDEDSEEEVVERKDLRVENGRRGRMKMAKMAHINDDDEVEEEEDEDFVPKKEDSE